MDVHRTAGGTGTYPDAVDRAGPALPGPGAAAPRRGTLLALPGHVLRPAFAQPVVDTSMKGMTMSYRVAINGFGRIGRNYLAVPAGARAARRRASSVVGDQRPVGPGHAGPPARARLDVRPAAPGRRATTTPTSSSAARRSRSFRERDPANLPLGRPRRRPRHRVDRQLRTRDDAAAHLKAGARRVLISAPGKDVDATLVARRQRRRRTTRSQHEILSAASCTTNCVAPMVKVLHEAFGVERGLPDHRARVHQRPGPARRAAQGPAPGPRRRGEHHPDQHRRRQGRRPGAAGTGRPPRRRRAAGAGRERLDLATSPCELARAGRPPTEVNAAFAAAARRRRWHGILRYTEAPIVSRDVIGDPASCVFDAEPDPGRRRRWSRSSAGTTTSGATPTGSST